MTTLLIDATLIILLLYAIRTAKDFYIYYQEVKQLKDELKGLMRHVQSSIKTASTTVESLQESIQLAAKHVTPYLPKAITLKDDLHFLLERGESVADRLEKLGTELKEKYPLHGLSPQSVVFDPGSEGNSPAPIHEIKEAPVLKEQIAARFYMLSLIKKHQGKKSK